MLSSRSFSLRALTLDQADCQTICTISISGISKHINRVANIMSKPWWHRTVWLFSGAVAVSASAASLYWYLYSRAATEHTMCERASDALGIIPASSSRQHAAASGQCGKQNGSSMGHAEAVGTPTAAAGRPPARFSSDSTCAESQHSSAAAVGEHSGLHAVATCPSSATVDGTVPADTIQPFCAVAGQSADSTAAADAAAGSATSPFAAAVGDAGQNLQVVSPAKQAPTVSTCSSSSVRDTAPVSDQAAHTAGQAGEEGGLHSRDTAPSKQFDQLQGGQQAQQLERHLPQQDELQQQQNLQQQGDLQQQEMLEQRQEEQDDQSQSCSAQAALSLHTPPPHQYEWQHPSLQQQQPFPTPPQSPRHVQPSGLEQQAGSQPQQHHPRTPEAQQQHLRQQQQSQPTQQHSSPELPGASPALQLTPRSSQDGVRHHRSFNTARHAPSLDTTVASAAVAHSLQLQYSPQLTQAGNRPAGAGAAAANVSAQGSAPVGTEGLGSNSSGAATEQRDAAVGHKVCLRQSRAVCQWQHVAQLCMLEHVGCARTGYAREGGNRIELGNVLGNGS